MTNEERIQRLLVHQERLTQIYNKYSFVEPYDDAIAAGALRLWFQCQKIINKLRNEGEPPIALKELASAPCRAVKISKEELAETLDDHCERERMYAELKELSKSTEKELLKYKGSLLIYLGETEK